MHTVHHQLSILNVTCDAYFTSKQSYTLAMFNDGGIAHSEPFQENSEESDSDDVILYKSFSCIER